MTLKNIINSIFVEERNGGGFLDFEAFVGEFEGNNIPHFHLENKVRKLKTAIRLDMPFYILHGDKTYILNSKEKKLFILWIKSKPKKIVKGNEQDGELPQNNWENLRNMWNNYYPQAKIKCSDMPNYSLLEKDYKDA